MAEVDELEPTNREPRKKWSTKRKILIFVLAAILVLVGGTVGFGWWVQRYLDGLIEKIDDPFGDISSRPEVPTEVQDKIDEGEQHAPVNILVLGSDSRISAGDPDNWQAGAQRTDAIMLVHVAGDRESATTISIPRDTWVPIPGYGENKINAAFSFGGPTLMIETVELLTDVKIDHFVITDFESFSTMTDALGGVTITLQTPLTTGGVTLQPGEHRLDGDQALSYVRQRYGLTGGDFSRVQRQQNWMRSIMREMFNKNILSDIGELTNFLETVAKSVAVDEGFTIGEMRDLLFSARNLRPGDINFLTMPHAGTGWSTDRQSIVIFDEERARPLFDSIKHDDVAGYLATNPEGVSYLPAQPE